MSNASGFIIQEGELSWYRDSAWLHPDGNYPEWALKEGKTLVKYTGKDPDVIIPDGISEIGDEAFFKNKYLETVTVPESVYLLGTKSFYSCTNLKQIVCHGTIQVWSDFITKKQDVVLVFLKNALDTVDTPFQEKALRGFIYATENDLPTDESVKEDNVAWIKRRRKKLYPTALENLPLLRLMLDNKIVPKKEVDDLLAQATEANQAETAALLLAYSQTK